MPISIGTNGGSGQTKEKQTQATSYLGTLFGNTFVELANDIKDSLVAYIGDYIPDIVPLNYLEDKIKDLANFLFSYLKPTIYNAGVKVGDNVTSKINQFIDDMKKQIEDKINQVTAELVKKIQALDNEVVNIQDLANQVDEQLAKAKSDLERIQQAINNIDDILKTHSKQISDLYARINAQQSTSTKEKSEQGFLSWLLGG